MTEIHVNLKRFDVPKKLGGICPEDRPVIWMQAAMAGVVKQAHASSAKLNVVIYPPESLLETAVRAIERAGGTESVSVGSQGVFTSDIERGANFGAFTTSLPAAAAVTYGCRFALVGHSEERLKLFSLLASYDETVLTYDEARRRATATVNQTIAASARMALSAGLKATLCVGETAEERGSGQVDFDAIEEVLRAQIEGLAGADAGDVIIAYEPRWAIGPGKTPPDAAYISEIATRIKAISAEVLGRAVPVLYGGGLKAENAGPIGGIENVDGGLIALTKFTDPIGFDPVEMGRIVQLFVDAKGRAG